MSGKISVLSAAPKVDVSPRVEGSGTSRRYEFRSLDDLVHCLDNGTFVLDVQVQADKFEEDGRVNMALKGRFSDHGPGAIYVALKKDLLEEKQNVGSTSSSWVYSLLELNAPNYNSRKELADTQEMYTRFLKHLEGPLLAIRQKYYPSHSESLHIPKVLKFKAFKPTVTRRYSKDAGMEEVKDEFKLADFITAPGKMMMRLNAPWIMEQKNLQNMMMGLTTSLARWKYLTDEEKLQEQRRKEERKKEEAKAQDAKRKREEKKASGSSSSSEAAAPAKRARAEALEEEDEDA